MALVPVVPAGADTQTEKSAAKCVEHQFSLTDLDSRLRGNDTEIRRLGHDPALNGLTASLGFQPSLLSFNIGVMFDLGIR
jgi:hypothetical protein